MAYVQKNNPFPVTSCGRRRTFTQGGEPGNDRTEESPFEKRKRKRKPDVRKTTKGKGRNFRTTKEGAGMTSKGVKAYRRKNPGSKLKTAVTGKVKPGSKDAARRRSFCGRSIGWKGERGIAARKRWKC
tara:strand:+ start:115 stop:498 length:384 start_codon:yes stop_codon:yes gene_type:complete